ncbi:hypothetical protein [uncultured Oscillibacter sp.]|uniref:hypothetical protein n=1 Tax=uncultured Oscillibacter sp. TaxID=876091 RepID=UPI00260A7FC1|nr:hypothetical protein [uncultured Oscillibacter sp.]
MGLVLGLGLMGALGGGALAYVCFEEARRLLRQGRRLPGACFGAGAAVCALLALGGAWMAWSIVDGFFW